MNKICSEVSVERIETGIVTLTMRAECEKESPNIFVRFTSEKCFLHLSLFRFSATKTGRIFYMR